MIAYGPHVTGKRLPASHVGVRRGFYRRTNPDGTFRHDLETRLRPAENRALGLLRDIDSAWPLAPVDKAAIAEYLGLQYVRGSRFREWYERITLAHGPTFAAALARWGSPADRITAGARGPAIVAELADKNQQLNRMEALIALVGTAFAHMHWTLLRFDHPWLLCSDHPLVLWPGAVDSTFPRAFPIGTGVTASVELRFPVSPFRAILGTWMPDTNDAVRSARQLDAAKLNGLTRANADAHWFHLPGHAPPVATAMQWPLSRTVLGCDYSWATAQDAPRRKRAVAVTQGMATLPVPEQPIIVLAPAAPGRAAT